MKTLSHENDGYIFSPGTDVRAFTPLILYCVCLCSLMLLDNVKIFSSGNQLI